MSLSSLGISRVKDEDTHAFVKFEEVFCYFVLSCLLGGIESAPTFCLKHLTAIIINISSRNHW